MDILKRRTHVNALIAAMPRPNSIAFSGCGTLNFYQVGVAAALQEVGWTSECHFGWS